MDTGPTDPESEALIWKLHRELNGLTRSARRSDTNFVSLDVTRRDTRQPASRSRAKPAGTSQQADPVAPSKRKKATIPDEEADEKVVSKAAKPTTTGLDQKPRGGRKAGYPAQGASHQPQQDSLTRDFPTSANPVPIAPLGTHVSPLVAAAVSAGQVVRERAKHLKCGEAAQRQVKCFYAGVRWGISLKAANIQSRADLASALNDSLAGEILSCGRGDNLHILFLDSAGSLSEFTSLRSAGSSAKENLQKWQEAVSRAVKVYVRRV